MVERCMPEGVIDVLVIVEEVYREHNRVEAYDIIGAARLWVEIRDEVQRVFIDEKLRKRFIRGVIEWGVFLKKYTFRRLCNKVLDYLSVFEVDEHKERYVKEFVIAYKEYIAKRWGMPCSSSFENGIISAARVCRILCKEYSITTYEYIVRSHEFWEKIDRPLAISSLSDIEKCRKRLVMYADVAKKTGVIRKEDYGNNRVYRKWKEILNLGVEKFLEKTKSSGYLKYVAELYVTDKKRGFSEEQLLNRYSPEKVDKNWICMKGEINEL